MRGKRHLVSPFSTPSRPASPSRPAERACRPPRARDRKHKRKPNNNNSQDSRPSARPTNQTPPRAQRPACRPFPPTLSTYFTTVRQANCSCNCNGCWLGQVRVTAADKCHHWRPATVVPVCRGGRVADMLRWQPPWAANVRPSVEEETEREKRLFIFCKSTKWTHLMMCHNINSTYIDPVNEQYRRPIYL